MKQFQKGDTAKYTGKSCAYGCCRKGAIVTVDGESATKPGIIWVQFPGQDGLKQIHHSLLEKVTL